MARYNVICNHVSKSYFFSVAEHLFRVPCKHCPATPRKGFSVPSPLASVPQRPLLPRGPVPHTLTCHSHSPNPFQQVLSVCTACSSWKTKAQFSLQTKRHGTHGSPCHPFLHSSAVGSIPYQEFRHSESQTSHPTSSSPSSFLHTVTTHFAIIHVTQTSHTCSLTLLRH